jgi:hypothetical protein
MRTQMVISLCALLAFLGLPARAQDQAASSGRRTLKAYSRVIPAPNFDIAAARQAATTSTGLKIFTYSINATKDQNFYSGTMVGGSPLAKKKGTTNIPTYIIPVIVVIGTTSFDPTVADTTCMAPPNDVPLTVFRNSPLFISRASGWAMNGVNVGAGQYIDAFQRANFWSQVQGSSYNVNLSPITVLAPQTYNVPAQDGNIISDAAFGNGGCGPNANPQGVEGEIYINDFDNWVTGTLLPNFPQITPASFPVILLYNVVMGLTQPPNVVECCVIGLSRRHQWPTIRADLFPHGFRYQRDLRERSAGHLCFCPRNWRVDGRPLRYESNPGVEFRTIRCVLERGPEQFGGRRSFERAQQ